MSGASDQLPDRSADGQGLDPQIVADLGDRWAVRRFAAGATIFLEGAPTPGLALVREGWVRVFRSSPEGRDLVLRFLGPGELWNGPGVVAGELSPASAVALEDCEIWFLSVDDFRRALAERPDLAVRIIHNLVRQIRQLADQMTDLTLLPVSARLARWLLDEARDDVVERPRWFTQAQLAARLGTVPDVAQRALSELVRRDLVRVERHQFTIVDRAGLEELAGHPT